MKLDTFGKIAAASLSAAVLNLIGAVLFILTLPAQVPVHFDDKLVCNGYGSRWTGLLMPAGFLIMFGLTLLIYSFSKNKQKNLHIMRLVALLCTAIFVVVTWFVLFMMRSDVKPGEVLSKQFWWVFPVLYGAVFLIIGNYLPTVRQNKVLGYRTPWTLNNTQCWKLTHQLAGKLAVITGLLTLIAGLVMKAAGVESMAAYMVITFASLAVVVLVPMVYSSFHRAD